MGFGADLVVGSDGGVGDGGEKRGGTALAGDAHQALPFPHSGHFLRPPSGNLAQLILRAHDAGHAADSIAAL
ncbi:hypothetical protein D3C80_2152600 [compost metagenome]